MPVFWGTPPPLKAEGQGLFWRAGGRTHAEQHGCRGEVFCSPLGFLPDYVDLTPRPSLTHMQTLQVSEVFRPVVLNLSCTLELLGSFGKWRYLVPLLGVCLSWPGLRPGHQDLEKLPG